VSARAPASDSAKNRRSGVGEDAHEITRTRRKGRSTNSSTVSSMSSNASLDGSREASRIDENMTKLRAMEPPTSFRFCPSSDRDSDLRLSCAPGTV
jgi:hypothetical protein